MFNNHFIPNDQHLRNLIEVTNTLNRVCNDIHPRIIETLKPYRGEQIIKESSQRSLIKKVTNVIEPILNKYRAGIYINCEPQLSIYMNVDMWYYYQRRISNHILLGRLDENNHLKNEDVEPCQYKDDYNFEEIKKDFVSLVQLIRQIEELEKKLYIFL